MTELSARSAGLRRERAAIRGLVRSAGSHDEGLVTLAEVLEYGVPPALSVVTVPEAYRWVRHHSANGERRLLRAAGCSEFATLGALTYRQRVALVNALRRED